MDIACWVIGGLCFGLLMLHTISDVLLNPLPYDPHYCPDAPHYGPEDLK